MVEEFSLENTPRTREAVAEQLEALAKAVRAGEFEFVALAFQRSGKTPAYYTVTGPNVLDYSDVLDAVGKLGVLLKRAQKNHFNTGQRN